MGLLAIILPLSLLAILLATTAIDGAERLSGEFLTGTPSRRAASAGIGPALAGTGMLMALTAMIALPLGVGAALWLEEYAKPTRLTRFVELIISTLAGVPSIIYALLALEVFVRTLGMGRSILAGASTLALLVLPMIIMARREALRTVPHGLREASLGLGGDRWVTLRTIVLPLALPGVLTGVILALARAIGETAPLITIGALTYVAFVPDSLSSAFTALPIQIFNWVSRPQADFHVTAAAAIVVLLAVLLLMNGLAIWLRSRLQRRIEGY
ncbi:MAG TPA: phosphate ABC transporter permease PstA [Myxococcota bacterium]|nr:phosphate ABC transporter permease PstA [Myxococcota bacterium]